MTGKAWFLSLSLGIVIVGLAFVALWQSDQMIRIGYEIQTIELQKKQRLELHKRLLIEAESLSAPDRIHRVAVSQLSMRLPLPKERIPLDLKKNPPGRKQDVSLR